MLAAQPDDASARPVKTAVQSFDELAGFKIVDVIAVGHEFFDQPEHPVDKSLGLLLASFMSAHHRAG